MKLRFLVWVAVFLTLSCSDRRIDVEGSQNKFYSHEAVFEGIQSVSCESVIPSGSKFVSFQNEEEIASASVSDNIKHVLIEAIQTIGAEYLSFSRRSVGQCSIYLSEYSLIFFGEGVEFGYRFNPQDLGEYEYDEDFFSKKAYEERNANRVRGEEPVKFSIELKNGWYMQYHMYP